MRKPKQNSNIWQYLNSVGVLEKGTEEEIKSAKKQYRKDYLLTYKQKQRKEKPEYIVMLSKENGEYENITVAAKKHSMSVTSFLKVATYLLLK